MKIFILVLLLISSTELRLHNNDIYELDDLLNKYDNYKYRPNKPYISDDTDDDDDDDNDEDSPPSYQRKKVHPPHKKVDNTDQESETNDSEDPLLLRKTTQRDDLSDTSSCFDGYNVKSDHLVKVKELKNGAHLIHYILIDKRTLPSNVDIKDRCLLTCCSEKTCDLAMLSEQPLHDGYKCYLFACNGTCPLASHQDYSILIPKKSSGYDTTPATTNTNDKSASTVSNVVLKRKSLFRETSVIIFLIFGVISTIILLIFIFRQCVASQKHGRKSKNYSVDADYLINGLYL